MKYQKEVVVVLVVVDFGTLNAAETVVQLKGVKRILLRQVFRFLFRRLLDGGPG